MSRSTHRRISSGPYTFLSPRILRIASFPAPSLIADRSNGRAVGGEERRDQGEDDPERERDDRVDRDLARLDPRRDLLEVIDLGRERVPAGELVDEIRDLVHVDRDREPERR